MHTNTLFLLVLLLALSVSAQERAVLVHVEDVQHKKVAGLEIGIVGGGSRLTGNDGNALLTFDTNTTPDRPTVQIIQSPQGSDYVIFSPYERVVELPSANSKTVIAVFVVKRRDLTALTDGQVVASLTAQVLKAQHERPTPQDAHNALDVVAKQYGYNTDQLNAAILSLGNKTSDPYESGLVALYKGDQAKAIDLLSQSADIRERTYDKSKSSLAEAVFFLGQSLYRQERFRDSGIAFERVAELDPNNPLVLNNAALSFAKSQDAASANSAKQYYLKAIAIAEQSSKVNPMPLATSLGNYAVFLLDNEDPSDAVVQVQRAIKLFTDAHLERDRRMSAFKDTLGSALEMLEVAKTDSATQDFTAAMIAYKEALDASEHGAFPDAAGKARVLMNMAELSLRERKYRQAEAYCRTALDIDASLPEVGKNSSAYAMDLYYLGASLYGKGTGNQNQISEAIAALEEAVAIVTIRLPLNHPQTQMIKGALAAIKAETGGQ